MKSSIPDFSDQWTNYTAQTGYYASEEIAVDCFGPLLSLAELTNKDICEVGSGNGRYLHVLSAHARSVFAIEPSDGIEVSKRYTIDRKNITFLKEDFYKVQGLPKFDFIFCLGVLHHMTDPLAALKKMRCHLSSGGSVILWVYGREGNTPYLIFAGILRLITKWCPHRALKSLCRLLVAPVRMYQKLCFRLRLPMRGYMLNVITRLDDQMLELVIYDQLNPQIAIYYRRAALEQMLRDAGFSKTTFHHRHGYSWTVRAE